MKGNKIGWVKSWRTLYDHEVYDDVFRGTIFQWLVALANYENNTPVAGLVRGDLIISQRDIARKWRIPRAKVRRILDWLEQHGMIARYDPPAQISAQITICNYSSYQETPPRNRPSRGKIGPDNVLKIKEYR